MLTRLPDKKVFSDPGLFCAVASPKASLNAVPDTHKHTHACVQARCSVYHPEDGVCLSTRTRALCGTALQRLRLTLLHRLLRNLVPLGKDGTLKVRILCDAHFALARGAFVTYELHMHAH